MIVIFTDLDGTLLDDGSYSFAPAHEALSEVLARHERSLASVFTKKERQELDRLLAKLGSLS